MRPTSEELEKIRKSDAVRDSHPLGEQQYGLYIDRRKLLAEIAALRAEVKKWQLACCEREDEAAQAAERAEKAEARLKIAEEALAKIADGFSSESVASVEAADPHSAIIAMQALGAIRKVKP